MKEWRIPCLPPPTIPPNQRENARSYPQCVENGGWGLVLHMTGLPGQDRDWDYT